MNEWEGEHAPAAGTPAHGGQATPVIHEEHSIASSGCDSGDDREFCNPEPPKEFLEVHKGLMEADKIGDTVFSKSWLFTTLMKLLQVIEPSSIKEKQVSSENGGGDQAVSSEDKEENQNDTNKEKKGNVENGIDIEDSLQDELCKLWDMSMNSEVVKFLEEFKAVELLTGAITKSKAPRATEICVGILGNMACNKKVNQQISSNEKLVELMLYLLEESDAPTLVETTRFLHVVLSNPDTTKTWLTAIKKDNQVFDAVLFILKSSTNNDLLRNAGDFVDKLLDVDDEVCSTWSTSVFVEGLLEAAKQIGASSEEALEIYLHIFELVSTNEKGVESLIAHGSELGQLVLQYLVKICSEDIIGIEGRQNVLASAFSVLNVVITSPHHSDEFLKQDLQVIRCALKVLEVVYPIIHKDFTASKKQAAARRRRRHRHESECKGSPTRSKSRTASESLSLDSVSVTSDKSSLSSQMESEPQSVDDTEDNKEDEVLVFESKMTKVLYDVLLGLLCDYALYIKKCDSEDVPRSIEYLNSMCSRERIYIFTWILKDCSTDETDYNAIFWRCAENMEQHRLLRIVQDALDMET